MSNTNVQSKSFCDMKIKKTKKPKNNTKKHTTVRPSNKVLIVEWSLFFV